MIKNLELAMTGIFKYCDISSREELLDVLSINPNDNLELRLEEDNEFDNEAIAIYINNTNSSFNNLIKNKEYYEDNFEKIGYVKKYPDKEELFELMKKNEGSLSFKFENFYKQDDKRKNSNRKDKVLAFNLEVETNRTFLKPSEKILREKKKEEIKKERNKQRESKEFKKGIEEDNKTSQELNSNLDTFF